MSLGPKQNHCKTDACSLAPKQNHCKTIVARLTFSKFIVKPMFVRCRTSYMMEKMFEKEKDHMPKPQFGKKKRFPGKDKKTDKPYPGVNGCAVIPLYLFKKDEDDADIVELAEFKKPEEIV